MAKIETPTEVVKNLKVEKSDFDAAMRRLIATPPIRGPKPAAKRHRSERKQSSR
jgi:hypothetical protein